MDKRAFTTLIDSYLKGSATAAEQQLLEAYYLKLAEKKQTNLDAVREQALEKLMFNNIIKGIRPGEAVKKRTIRLWSSHWIHVAAILLVLSALAVILYSTYHNRLVVNSVQDLHAHNDIAPGKNTAVLTLPNGKKITLSNLKTGIIVNQSALTYNDGSILSGNTTTDIPVIANDAQLRRQSRTEELLNLSIPLGGQYQITLDDGTRIYLNAASSLEYPPTFAGKKERLVTLTGEAYFVVKHNAKQPFKVRSKGQIVEDIGTEFNVNAYTDETVVKTTLIEGSAKVASLQSGSRLGSGQIGGRHSGTGRDLNAVVLTPGKQSQLKIDGTLQVTDANTEQAIAWKNGYFLFDNQNINSIMKQVSKWYNVEVYYDGIAPVEGFNGIISRSKNISQVLKMLEQTNAVHFKIEGRRVYVSP